MREQLFNQEYLALARIPAVAGALACRTMKLELSPGNDIVPAGFGALEHQFMISDTSREPNLYGR